MRICYHVDRVLDHITTDHFAKVLGLEMKILWRTVRKLVVVIRYLSL